MEKVSADHVAFGHALRQFRKRTGLSQEGLGDVAGLHRTYIGGIERGEQNPSFTNILRISKALDAKLSDIVRAYEGAADEA